MINNYIAQMANSASEITVEALQNNMYKVLNQELPTSYQEILPKLRVLTRRLIESLEMYRALYSKKSKASSTLYPFSKLEFQKELIYKDFFELQNLINLYLNKKVVITYVHSDPNTSRREIRITDNTIDHLGVDPKYNKLSYQMEHHYLTLKNSLPEEENEGLQNIAAEAERRYRKYKGRILWKYNSEWIGYQIWNRGPINEAFVDFYINNYNKFTGNKDEDMHVFMTSSSPQGVIQADTANGFLIGDTFFGNLLFAVKGVGRSPQGFVQVITELKKMEKENFSEESFNVFKNRFIQIAQEKARPLAKKMHADSIAGVLKEMEQQVKDTLSFT